MEHRQLIILGFIVLIFVIILGLWVSSVISKDPEIEDTLMVDNAKLAIASRVRILPTEYGTEWARVKQMTTDEVIEFMNKRITSGYMRDVMVLAALLEYRKHKIYTNGPRDALKINKKEKLDETDVRN